MVKFIYKICNSSEWLNFKKKKKFLGTKKDLLDGFIHLSNKRQVRDTLKKYYFKKDKLILLKISTSELKNLVWENSQSGIAFPHVYSYLTTKDVICIYKISIKKNGTYLFLSNSSNTNNF